MAILNVGCINLRGAEFNERLPCTGLILRVHPAVLVL